MESRALATLQRVSRASSASPVQKRGFGSVIRLLKPGENPLSALKRALRSPAEDITAAKKELRRLLGDGRLEEVKELRASLSQGQADKLFITSIELFIESGRPESGWIAGNDSDIQKNAAELASFLAIHGRGISEGAMGMLEGNEPALVEAAKPTGSVEACSKIFAAVLCALNGKEETGAADALLARIENAAGAQGEKGEEIILRVRVHYGAYKSLSSLLVPNRGRGRSPMGGEFAEAGI